MTVVTNYTQAAAYLGTKTVRPLRGTGHRVANEVRRINESSIAIRYCNTDVVTYHADGRTVLDSGGFRTVTTKARINDHSDARVWQKDFEWFVGYRGQTTPFADGMVLG